MQLKNNFSFNIFKNSDFDYLTIKVFYFPNIEIKETRANEFDENFSREIEFSAPTKIYIGYSASEFNEGNERDFEYLSCIFKVLGIGLCITRQKGY
jgi:hypothetical protein